MAKKDKKKKSDPEAKEIPGGCPVKEGDNCLVPGVYSDSEPIGGG
ncbi:MAG: hypothetical protein PHF24_07425 [Syntrophomonas sp.]|nr:hypothetical protein [Syntrophomonas sp.]